MTIELLEYDTNQGYGLEWEQSITIPAGALILTVHMCNYRTAAVTLDGSTVYTTTIVEHRSGPGSLDEGRACYVFNAPPGTYTLKFETNFTGDTLNGYAIFSGFGDPDSINKASDTGAQATGTVSTNIGGLVAGAWFGTNSGSSTPGWANTLFNDQWNAPGNRIQMGYDILSQSGNKSYTGMNYDGALGMLGVHADLAMGGMPVMFD